MLQLIHYTVTDILYTCPDTVVGISLWFCTSSIARGKSIWKSRGSLLTAKIDQVGEVDLNRNTQEYLGQLPRAIIHRTLPTRAGASGRLHAVQKPEQEGTAQLHMQSHRKTTDCNRRVWAPPVRTSVPAGANRDVHSGGEADFRHRRPTKLLGAPAAREGVLRL